MSCQIHILNCQTVNAVSGYENLGKIIVAINYEIKAPNGGKFSEWINVSTMHLNNFIPYNQLIELDLINLVKQTLGNTLSDKEFLAIENGEHYGLPWQQSGN